jgi:PAS domain S-box-containing protein
MADRISSSKPRSPRTVKTIRKNSVPVSPSPARKADQNPRISEERFRLAFDMSPVGSILADKENRFFCCNKAFCDFLGYAEEELLGKTFMDVTWPPDREIGLSGINALPAGQARCAPVQKRYVRKDGSVVWGEVTINLVRDPDGRPLYWLAIVFDISARCQAEAALQASEEKWRLLVTALPDYVALHDAEGRYLFLNRYAEGFSEKDIIGKSAYDLLAKDSVERLRNGILTCLKTGRMQKYEFTAVGSNKEMREYENCMVPFTERNHAPSVIVIARDITERKRAEEQVQAALREKEVLLREVHHRVKNTLQAMIALMHLRAAHVPDQISADLFKELEEQARAMALVYEQLYQSKNLAQVGMEPYLRRLADGVFKAFSKSRPIDIRLEIEPLALNVDQAMPCGLIANELFTNSLKHAFPPGFSGQPFIRIGLRRAGTAITLIVADNGIGLPSGFTWQDGRIFGLRLVELWATHQLGGRIDADLSKGTAITVEFEQTEDHG